MIWQDILITAGTFVLSVAMIPTLRGSQKPPIASSIPTALVLASFSIAFVTMGLTASCIGAAIQSIVWSTLFIQRIKQEGR